MNKFKLEAFKREFPFLRELDLGRDPEIRIERLDVRWLGRRAENRSRETDSVSYSEVDEVYLVIEGGCIKLEIARIGSRSAWDGESLLEALSRWADGDINSVAFVIWNRWFYDHTEPSEARWSNEWTILKLERGVTLAQRIAEAEAKAEAEVRREVAF